MPQAKDVKPYKWSNIKILYDDSEYSIIHGEYDGASILGERWNGDPADNIGYPSQGGNPLWFVVPKFLWGPILLGVLSQLSIKKYTGSKEHRNNTLLAIAELLKS